MEATKQKELGAFYTPEHTVEYMVNKLTNFNIKSKLLEPSGGDGSFVSVILKNKLLKSEQLTVWDINQKLKSI
jgi:type I restriction-modification system DNA methylase subunit